MHLRETLRDVKHCASCRAKCGDRCCTRGSELEPHALAINPVVAPQRLEVVALDERAPRTARVVDVREIHPSGETATKVRFSVEFNHRAIEWLEESCAPVGDPFSGSALEGQLLSCCSVSK
jgi:hypothetical protein